MGLKNASAAILCATLMAWSGMSIAEEYRPGEFLGLDLSRAVLSPKPLGPATQFAPVRIEARADRASPAAPVRVEHATPAKTRAAHRRVGKPRGAARKTLARKRGNPLDAQARDTRIQAWPCKSGGICNWK
jgi:hypothetical protein